MRTSFISRCAAIVVSLVVGFAVPAVADAKPDRLTLAFIPQENPEKLIGDIRAITGYMERRLGVEVRGYVTQDHAAAVEALKNGDADISFMGALPFVMARAESGAEILLSEIYRGQPSYTSAIFVRADSAIRAPADLRKKTIAFADPISESGFLYPLEIFVGRGLLTRNADLKSFFKRVYFAGGYQQAVQAVANGLVDAAGVSIYALLLLPPADRAKLRMIAESASIPSHAVIARKGLDVALSKSFVAAMLDLNRPTNRHLLKHLYGPDGYALPRIAAYDEVARLARLHGLIK